MWHGAIEMLIVDSQLDKIKILPKSELEEIMQNVKTILSTVKGTVPLDRGFGIDKQILDLPIGIARAKISAAVVVAVNKFEPRVKVRRVFYNDSNSMEGKLTPSVEVALIKDNLRGSV